MKAISVCNAVHLRFDRTRISIDKDVQQKKILLTVDGHVKSQIAPVIVIPANAGIQEIQPFVGSRVRGNDGLGEFLRDHQL